MLIFLHLYQWRSTGITAVLQMPGINLNTTPAAAIATSEVPKNADSDVKGQSET
jgi:hypothetical protein